MVITLQMEAAQYLWTLLTDQHQNFTKLVLFGCTLQNSEDGNHLTSIEANPLNRHFWPNWYQILKDLCKSPHFVKQAKNGLQLGSLKKCQSWTFKDDQG